MAFAYKSAKLRRLKRILSRQGDDPKWGGDYQPASALGTEQPSISRPAGLSAAKLGGRDVISQSRGERSPLLVALHHPGCFEVHEQKKLSPVPCAHPLTGHRKATSLNLPTLRGTVEVADALGYLNRHPKVWNPSANSGLGGWVPVPFVGDILLFLEDSDGPYCVNWTVKQTEADFLNRTIRKKPLAKNSPPEKRELQRHEIEQVYYADGDIPTYRVTKWTFDRELSINLLNLFYLHDRELLDQRAWGCFSEIVNFVDKLIDGALTLHELTLRAAKHFNLDAYDVKTVIYRAVWERRLRVDLFRKFMADEPLFRERDDIFEVYGHLFKRAEK